MAITKPPAPSRSISQFIGGAPDAGVPASVQSSEPARKKPKAVKPKLVLTTPGQI